MFPTHFFFYILGNAYNCIKIDPSVVKAGYDEISERKAYADKIYSFRAFSLFKGIKVRLFELAGFG